MSTKKSIKGTQTEKNLVIAYLAESSAYTRYTFYAQQADKELYYPEGGSVEVPMAADAGVIGTTAENLEIAAKEEINEGVKLYTSSAEVAEKEGFPEIAAHFREIAEIENRHHRRFMRYLKQVKDGTVWKRKKPVTWQCLVCGYQHKGTEPPKVCPACDHPYQHYMAIDEPDE